MLLVARQGGPFPYLCLGLREMTVVDYILEDVLRDWVQRSICQLLVIAMTILGALGEGRVQIDRDLLALRPPPLPETVVFDRLILPHND